MSSRFTVYANRQKSRLILSLTAGIGYIAAGMLEPWPLKMIFDNVFLDEPLPGLLRSYAPGTPAVLLYLLIGGMASIAVLRGMLYYTQNLLLAASGHHIASDIRLDLYDHLQRLSFSFHDRRKTGDMLARLTTDIRILRDILAKLPLTLTTEVLLMAGMLVVMALMDWQLTLIAAMVFPLLALLIKKYRLPMKQAMRKQREKEGYLATTASEVLGAIQVVQGFHQESYEVSKFQSKNKNSLKTGLKATRLEAKLRWASELSVAVVTALILGFAGRRVLSGVISPGELLVFAYYLRAFNRPLRRVSKVTEQLSRATASGERILEMMNVESEVSEKPGAKRAPRFRGEIEYRGVSFDYKPGKPALVDINLRIAPGERVAVVGHSGSGKSTLASLLPRFYDCTSGSIFIDGVDVRDWTLQSLREQIAVIFQEPVLFATSIAENIAYGKPGVGIEEVKKAAEQAGIHRIIQSLPDGYETLVGERGATLSGGQRQCVAIARAMIKNASIVILDEPTSGLDIPSAMLVMKAIRKLMEEKTVMIISHQAETVQDVDRVVRMSRKRICSEKTLGKLQARETEPITAE